MVAEVRQLRDKPLTDIAGRLRDLAYTIETGGIQPDVVALVIISDDGAQFQTFGHDKPWAELAGYLLGCANKLVR